MISRIRPLALATLCALGALATLPAQATLSPGKAVELTYLYPNLGTVYAGPITVTGGTSPASFAGILNIGFTDTSISMTLTVNAGINAVAFDGLRFVDLNGNLGLGNLVLDTQATTYAGFTAARLSHAPNTLFVNLQGLPGQAGQTIVLGVAPAVPEPASAALLLAGVAALAWRRRG